MLDPGYSDAEEGHIPFYRVLGYEAQIEEERRVLYVGMTRAEERLNITSVLDRDGRRNPSAFVIGLPPDHVTRRYHYRP